MLGAGWLRKKLSGGRKKEYRTDTYEVPSDPQTLEKLIDEITQKKLGEQQARIDELEEENEELKKKKQKLQEKQELDAMERAWKIEQLVEKQRKENSIFIPWFSQKNAPLLTSIPDNRQPFKAEDGSGETISLLRGISLEGGLENENPEVRLLWRAKREKDRKCCSHRLCLCLKLSIRQQYPNAT